MGGGEGENAVAFSPSSTMIFTPSKANCNFSGTFILSSANPFNLDHSKIVLLFGKKLKGYSLQCQRRSRKSMGNKTPW